MLIMGLSVCARKKCLSRHLPLAVSLGLVAQDVSTTSVDSPPAGTVSSVLVLLLALVLDDDSFWWSVVGGSRMTTSSEESLAGWASDSSKSIMSSTESVLLSDSLVDKSGRRWLTQLSEEGVVAVGAAVLVAVEL